ncbi:hypothetical protein ACFPMF_15535 [Larkinella bovis]|uniref:Uncharacterized protein n=1 Tax=Larkinella bovis TaxID=683041 RepID=A0ABW0ICV8_9BACT
MTTKKKSGESVVLPRPKPKQSIKDRIMPFFEHHASIQTAQVPLLTEEELAAIDASISTKREKNIFNQYIEWDRQLLLALTSLEQFRYALREDMAYITGYAMLWESYQQTQDFFNVMVSELEEGKKKKMLDYILQEEQYHFAELKVSDQKIQFLTDTPNNTLEPVIAQWRVHAERLIRTGKAIMRAIGEFMSKTGYQPKAYVDRLNEVAEEFSAEQSFLPKYGRRTPDAVARNDRFAIYPDANSIEYDREYYEDYAQSLSLTSDKV